MRSLLHIFLCGLLHLGCGSELSNNLDQFQKAIDSSDTGSTLDPGTNEQDDSENFVISANGLFSLTGNSNFSIDYTEGTATSREFVLSNLGETALQDISISISGADVSRFQISANECASISLEVDGACSFEVTASAERNESQSASIDIATGSETLSKAASAVSTGYPFITVWKTDNAGASAANQISLPLEPGGSYDFTVEWGDGTSSTINSHNSGLETHTYDSSGTYTIKMYGAINGFSFNNSGDRLKLIDIVNWGSDLKMGNTGGYFYGCSNLLGTAVDAPDLSQTTSLQNIFRDAAAFNMDIGGWNVTSVTTLENAFWGATTFDQNISSWRVGNVTNLTGTFRQASSYNQPLNDWDVSSVTTMLRMFRGAVSFNQPLSDWNTGNVVSMEAIFENADSFNQDLSAWDTSSNERFSWMFSNNDVFDQDISNWNFEAGTIFQGIFSNANLSTQNYDNLLIALDAQSVATGITLDVSSTYSAAAATARANLTNVAIDNWTINDDGAE